MKRAYATDLTDEQWARVQRSTQTTALVMATLSAHAAHLPEHVIKAAAIAAGNAAIDRNPT